MLGGEPALSVEVLVVARLRVQVQGEVLSRRRREDPCMTGEEIPDPEQVAAGVQRAKDLVFGFASSQVGNYHAFAQLAFVEQEEALEDAQIRYFVIHTFSAVVAAFAQALANERTTDPILRDELAMEAIRVAIDGIEGPEPRTP